MQTPWEKAKNKQHTHEKRFSRTKGAKPQINSGRLWFSKRDNMKFDFLVENREIEADSYTIKRKELVKLRSDAVFHHSLPAMNIAWPSKQEDWMLIPTSDFESIMERLLEYEAKDGL